MPDAIWGHIVSLIRLGLYTVLPSPILYGVWHTQGASVAGRILRNGRAIVLQEGRRCMFGEGNTRMIHSHNEALK